jgi:hypothetical protein
VPRRIVAVVATAGLCCSIAGCSSARTETRSGSSTTTIAATPITMTARHVTGVVDRYMPGLRAAIAGERDNCGGRAGVEQADPGAARKCEKSLRDISNGAQDLASALVLMRPPDALTTRVADTTDAARPVPVVYRQYSTSECLPTPRPGTSSRARCDTAGREFATLIAALATQLDRWRP